MNEEKGPCIICGGSGTRPTGSYVTRGGVILGWVLDGGKKNCPGCEGTGKSFGNKKVEGGSHAEQ